MATEVTSASELTGPAVPGPRDGGSVADGKPTRSKVFRRFDLVLFTVCAVLVADTVGASAAIGVQGLTFWVLLAIVFFVPYGLVSAELGAAWPQEGGIYVWVREAFGAFWGSMTSWLYWVNVALWMPSVFVLLTGTMISVFFPGMGRVGEASIVVALVWLTVAIGIADLHWAKWVPNVGAIVKVVVLLGLGVVGIVYAVMEGPANSFAVSSWMPSWGSNYAFIPVIVYSYMGFELMNSAGSEIRNPRRDVPKAIAFAGAVTLFVYVLATVGVLAAVPLKDVSIVTGIADALKVSFDQVFGTTGVVYQIVIVALLFTFLTNMVSWSMGANRTIAATGLDRTAPLVFGHRNRRFDTPDYAFVLMGVIATVLTVADYLVFATSQDVFWSIFAVSSIVFLMPYLLMFPAAWVLRRRAPDVVRPYRVPGGRAGIAAAVVLCELGVLATIVLFFKEVPEGTSPALYWLITGGGTLLSALAGLLLYLNSRRHLRARPPLDGPAVAGTVA